MSIISIERPNFSHSNHVIIVLLTPGSAIVTSRKRKLHELYTVATHGEGLYGNTFTKPDAPPTTQSEIDFLQANEILQYVVAID